MTSELLENIRAWYQKYVEKFISENSQFAFLIQPRVEHNCHVAINCRELAEELGWPENEVITAEILGLLHDVGRFSQFAEFGTFVDTESVNHGERGYEVISRSLILSSFPSRYQPCILDGIRYHNCREFQERAHPESLAFVKLVRDADKLDKYRDADEFIEEQCGKHIEPLFTVQSDGPINRKAVENIRRNRKVSKKNILSQFDFQLLQLSWIFEINYHPTFKRISDSRILERIIGILPDNEEIRIVSQHILTYLKSHV